MDNSKLDGCKVILILDNDGESLKVDGKLIRFIEEESRAVLNIGADELKNSDVAKDRPVRVNFINEEKGVLEYKGRAVYYLKGRMHVEKLSFISLVQRRKDVKVNLNNTGMVEVEVKGEEAETQIVEIPVRYRDISAGGICFHTNKKYEEFEIGKTIKTCFQYGRAPITLSMKILRESEEKEGAFSYGCQFLTMSKVEESILREFVFKAQLGAHKQAKARKEAEKEAAELEMREAKEKLKNIELMKKSELKDG